ncbi:hypothetical protein [Rhodococcus tukisamuensis]|nr:hypothetical protein [Rhodococcus tukisamuensis]
MAARRSMRLSAPGDGGKFATVSSLKPDLPGAPAAVPLYNKHGRTALLAFDLDAKRHGADQVDTDFERLLIWLRECGGRMVTDRSTSGGRHILVPLAKGTSLRVDEVSTLLALLEARLPTFDKMPMLNATHGCISVPGSLCREGGHRQLDGTLADAADAFADRSEHGVVARMVALLGGGGARQSRPRTAVAAVQVSLACEERLIGAGDTRRLHPSYCLTSPVSIAVDTFARTGRITNPSRWPSPSEARQSVISSAVLRGANAADIEARLESDYAGLRKTYNRYGSPENIAKALRRDVATALPWAASVAGQFRVLAHKNAYTGGYGGDGSFRGDPIRRRWLATAHTWIDQEFRGSRQRPVLHAVVQALAYTSALAGELVEGVPVVAIGGRSLSLAAGLMSEATVWAALRVLRDTPGSPVLRVAQGAGQLPDRYALTTPAMDGDPTEVAITRAHVEPVHHAWSVLGLRARRLYDLINSGQVTTVKDALAAAQLGTSAGYEALTDLRVAGLITMDKGALALGEQTLDQVADDAGLAIVAAERVVRHRAERVVWHAWLENRFRPPPPDRNDAGQRDSSLAAAIANAPVLDALDSELMWAATMAAGPPQVDPYLDALDSLSDQFGAVIVPAPSNRQRPY